MNYPVEIQFSFLASPNQPYELIIVVLLIIYIGYIHFLLSKKNIQLKRFQERLNYIHGEIHENIEKEPGKTTEKRDYLLDKDILDFIFENDKARKIFVHYTKDKEDADKILEEGFKFIDSFYKTAEEVRNDITDLLYKHNRHKSYGDYLIIISIDKDIYNYYLKQTDKVPSYEIVVEQLLTEKPPYLNEDSEMVYTFHHKFVKGYVNYVNGEIVENHDFNPTYNSNNFYENLKKLTYGS
jgi:hypothetical protein